MRGCKSWEASSSTGKSSPYSLQSSLRKVEYIWTSSVYNIGGFNISEIIRTGMSKEQKALRHKLDSKWIDPDGMTYEEYQAEMDKMWPRMAEPDEEGIDLHPDDPRRRFIATREGLIFSQAAPLTEEDRLEAERLLNQIAKPGIIPGKKVEREEAKMERKRGI